MLFLQRDGDIMKKIIGSIRNVPLFIGVKDDNMEEMLNCLNATTKTFSKNEYIETAGDAVTKIGIVLEGDVNIIKEDYWGNRSIIGRCEAGNMFGEAFACSGVAHIPVSVVAVSDSTILFIDYDGISSCNNSCNFHLILIRNMMKILAGKNIMLTEKIQHMSKRTTKEKLVSYLSQQAKLAGGDTFTIPFNRQELADYLGIDRSAMSNELSKLRNSGKIEFYKSQFKLLK